MSFSFLSSWIELPVWKLALDSAFGFVMWLMLVRFVLLIFFSEQSKVILIAQILQIGAVFIKGMRFFIPVWLNIRAHELYLAVLLLAVRYYILPALADYQVNHLADMPLEIRLIGLFEHLSGLF